MANIEPGEETCANPGVDDDCNGVEDDIENLDGECNTGEPGICGPGRWICENEELLCTADESPRTEECDGVDSDCDGVADNLDEDACGTGETCDDDIGCQCGEFGGHCGSGELCVSGLCCVDDRCSTPMVTVPGGVFLMGCDTSINFSCHDDEGPYHEVDVPEFEIDVTEVTLGQYGACVNNGACIEPLSVATGCNWRYDDRDDHPANCIDWNKSKAYCEWVGKRLCSESEWEKGGRGTDERIYPWGDETPTCERAVMNDGGEGCGEGQTWSVGSKPAGIYELYDMVGNVYEWVEDDWHDSFIGAPSDGSAWIDSPRGEFRSVRGGSFDFTASGLRTSNRYLFPPDFGGVIAGTRCCRYVR